MSEAGNILQITYGGNEILSKEIILKIKEAEAEAQKIRSDASDEAAARIRRAESEGKRLCDKAEDNAARANREKLNITSDRAEELLKKAKADADADAEALKESAEFNLREAVRFIIAGVQEQCQ